MSENIAICRWQFFFSLSQMWLAPTKQRTSAIFTLWVCVVALEREYVQLLFDTKIMSLSTLLQEIWLFAFQNKFYRWNYCSSVWIIWKILLKTRFITQNIQKSAPTNRRMNTDVPRIIKTKNWGWFRSPLICEWPVPRNSQKSAPMHHATCSGFCGSKPVTDGLSWTIWSFELNWAVLVPEGLQTVVDFAQTPIGKPWHKVGVGSYSAPGSRVLAPSVFQVCTVHSSTGSFFLLW